MILIIILLLLIIALPLLAQFAAVGSAFYFFYKIRYFIYAALAIFFVLLVTGNVKPNWRKIEYYLVRFFLIVMFGCFIAAALMIFSMFKDIGL